MKKLFAEAIVKFTAGVVLLGALIFLPGGTLRYFGGWLLMGILFVPMFAAGLVMLAKNPGLLRSRLDAKEKLGEQALVVKLSGLMFLAGFVLAGLDYRFGWVQLGKVVQLVGAAAFLGAYLLYAEVLRENTWLSRTIEVQENQTVVSTGLYGIVRHPMYTATVVMFLDMPVVLGSGAAVPVFCLYPLIIARRIQSEETFLEANLPGYREYKKKVKYRLIPFVW